MCMRCVRQFIPMVVLCTVACAAPITPVTSERIKVSRERIVEAMQAAGFETSPAQLELLSNVTSTSGASLRVAKVRQESAGTMLAQLNCQERQCLPFYVLVHGAYIENNTVTTASRTASGNRTEARPLIARGKPLTLIIETTSLRIVLPAVSMEGGIQGQVIRVSSPDHKQVYRAEVVSDTTVRGTL